MTSSSLSAGAATALRSPATPRAGRVTRLLRWRPHSADLRAGAVSALVMLPQAVSFSVLAGLPPEMGIYSSVIPVIVAALLGPSALLLSGPNTAVALMLGLSLLPLGTPASPEYLGYAITLTAMVGIVQIVAALLGAGRLLARLPRYTASGLNMGIGAIMITCQIAPAMGLINSRQIPSFLAPVIYGERWQDANLWSIGVAATAILAGHVFERLRKPWMPSLVAAMLAGALAGWALDLAVGFQVTHLDRIGHLHLTFDSLRWPSLHADELYILKQLALSAVAIAFVGGLQSVIILQSTQPGAGASACRREVLAQAACNLSAAVCGGYACSGSFNRTAAHIDAGAVTRMAAVISSVLLLALALVAAPAFASIPHAAIAGALALVGWSMIKSGWRNAARADRRTRYATLALALCVPLTGIAMTLVLALLLTVLQPLFTRDAQPATAG